LKLTFTVENGVGLNRALGQRNIVTGSQKKNSNEKILLYVQNFIVCTESLGLTFFWSRDVTKIVGFGLL
jgi:hypothetical protein